MRKLYCMFAIILLLFGVTSSAGVFNIPSGTAEAGVVISPVAGDPPGGDCPDRTYVAYWDGDHTSGTTYMCVDSGGSSVEGTLVGGTLNTTYGESGSNGLHITAVDHAIAWGSLGNDFIDETSAITVWIRVRFGTTDGSDNTLSFVELTEAAHNDDHITVRATDDEYVRGYWYGQNTGDYEVSTSTFSRDGSTWYTVGASFRADSGTYAEDTAVSMNGGSSWTADNDDPVSMAGELVTLVVGNYFLYSTAGDVIDIDRVEIIQGWEASCPW